MGVHDQFVKVKTTPWYKRKPTAPVNRFGLKHSIISDSQNYPVFLRNAMQCKGYSRKYKSILTSKSSHFKHIFNNTFHPLHFLARLAVDVTHS